jgi:hypothetical protein
LYILIGRDWYDEQTLKVSQQRTAELNRYLCNDQES